MATVTTAQTTLHQRAVHELKEFTILFVYLYITIGAVVLLKTAVLHTQGIDSVLWGRGGPGLSMSGASNLWLRNAAGVVLHLKGTQEGVTLSLGREKILIEML